MVLQNGQRQGCVTPPISKSHLHRLLIADFLGGEYSRLKDSKDDPDDILATKRCLRALGEETTVPTLDCGESGSTARFIRPIAAALGKKPTYIQRGRLAQRPAIDYETLDAGIFQLPGNVSSQFATGLLFALPLLNGDSQIIFTTPLESRGYVDMTLEVLEKSQIKIIEKENGFIIPGNQRFKAPLDIEPEIDWSGAAFWLAMNKLGSKVEVLGLSKTSRQPDRRVIELLSQDGGEKDMSQCPDLFPALAVAAAGTPYKTTFTKIARLRIKESNRVEAVAKMLSALGIKTQEDENTFTIWGEAKPFSPKDVIETFSDHRIAMSAAIAATHSTSPVAIDNSSCAAKSYPCFFAEFNSMGILD